MKGLFEAVLNLEVTIQKKPILNKKRTILNQTHFERWQR